LDALVNLGFLLDCFLDRPFSYLDEHIDILDVSVLLSIHFYLFMLRGGQSVLIQHLLQFSDLGAQSINLPLGL
jgi:hypothetical protein